MKRLGTGLLVTVVLCGCLFGTTFSLHPAYAWTNAPTLNMNNSLPIIHMGEDEFLEPGMTIRKKFKIQNTTGTPGTETENPAKSYYYGFYFRQNSGTDVSHVYKPLSGELAETLQISILDANTNVLITGTMASMREDNIIWAVSNNKKDFIEGNTTKNLYFQIYYPTNVGNRGMGEKIENFEICLAFDEVTTTTP